MTEKTDLRQTRFTQFIEFLKQSRKLLTMVLILLTVVSIGIFDIQIPYISPFVGNRRFFFVGLFVSMLILYIPTSKFVKWFYSADYDVVFEINANPDDDKVYCGVYGVGVNKMTDMTVKGRTPLSWRTAKGRKAYLCRKIDLEREEMVTTHHAEKSDIEMLEYENAVDEARVRTNKWANFGMRLYAKFDTVVEKVRAEYWKKKTDESIELKTNSKEMLEEILTDEIEGFEEKTEEINATEKSESKSIDKEHKPQPNQSKNNQKQED